MYKFSSVVHQFPGHGGWHFITVPLEISKEIKFMTKGLMKRGWGSVKVEAQIEAPPLPGGGASIEDALKRASKPGFSSAASGESPALCLTWQTSIFPNSDGTYLMGIKKSIREAAKVNLGQTISLSLKLVDLN